MKAAVVETFDAPPRYGEFAEPRVEGEHEMLVDVLAAGLHHRVRSQASGSHYTSSGVLPLIPGVDGVGRSPDGELRYFVLPHTALGSMADKTVIDLRRSVPLAADVDPAAIAAAANPVMSSWIALRHRVDFTPGMTVMVFGATGSSGRLATQVARRLGAGRVVAVGRDARKLAALDVDATIDLSAASADHRLATEGAEADVVLDYLWGPVTARALRAIVPARTDDQRQLTWIEIGSMAEAESAIPSAALRATRLSLVGSGQGSVAPGDIVADLGDIASEIASGAYHLDVRKVPLSQVESAWEATDDARVVLIP